MKKLFLSSALSIASLAIAPSVFAGPGESSGNTGNDCNTSSGSCPITPTKFSTIIYKVALCTSNPMADNASLDWDGNGCVTVFNNTEGQETGDIFSETGATLNAADITVPSAGTYEYTAALFDKDFKVGSLENPFEMMKYIADDFLLLLGGTGISAFVGWRLSKIIDMEKLGFKSKLLFSAWIFILRWVSPLFLMVIWVLGNLERIFFIKFF